MKRFISSKKPLKTGLSSNEFQAGACNKAHWLFYMCALVSTLVRSPVSQSSVLQLDKPPTNCLAIWVFRTRSVHLEPFINAAAAQFHIHQLLENYSSQHIAKACRAIHTVLSNPNRNPIFDCLSWKSATTINPAVRNNCTNFVTFELGARTGQRDRWTDHLRNAAIISSCLGHSTTRKALIMQWGTRNSGACLKAQ